MNLQRIKHVVVCSAIVALCIAGAGLLPTQPVAGQGTTPGVLQGAAALDHLKQNGQYESLQAAMRQARFTVSRAEQTPLGRAAWHAPNPTAGYDAYITEEGVSIAVDEKTFVSLSLHSRGYGQAMQGVAPAVWRASWWDCRRPSASDYYKSVTWRARSTDVKVVKQRSGWRRQTKHQR
jgi:hypothetical protein